jgi:CheY-like chemotaxis protein
MRRALIAEDSITARVFLWRLLEQHGFEVHTVTSADGLRGALERGPWTAIFADVELSDAHRGDHLRALEPPAGGSGSATIALVRDAEDEAWAASAGVRHTLRKPFEREALERLLASLGLERAS